MKKLLFIIAIVFNSLLAFPQNDVTKFLGIPVDGTRGDKGQVPDTSRIPG